MSENKIMNDDLQDLKGKIKSRRKSDQAERIISARHAAIFNTELNIDCCINNRIYLNRNHIGCKFIAANVYHNYTSGGLWSL